MKSRVLVMTMTLILLVAGSGVMNAQRGTRGQMPDTVRMNRPGNRGMQMRHMQVPPGFMRMHMMAHMEMARRNPGMMPPVHSPHPGFGPQAPGFKKLEMIPNLTEKQKKEIADLGQKHADEMKKFREETTSKVKQMKEAHKKKVMELLTDEQKKFILQ